MSKSLYELSSEYEKSIALVQESVADVRAGIIEAKKAHDYDRVYLLRRELTVLYEEIVDMKMIVAKLKNYNNQENGRRVKNDYQQTYNS